MTKTEEGIAMTRKYMVADLFCGAGGSSTGAKKAIREIGGEMELVAINHWPTAIATHSANHPEAVHVVEDVSLVDPEHVVEDGWLDLLMASPECKWYSRARGGKPVHDQGRMAPWAVMNWLTKLDIRCVLIENVPEFTEWGPLDKNNRPDRKRKGEYFQAWFMTFLNLGYQAEWRKLNAADYGDVTSRVRFFLIARRDGLPIRWPEPTHAKAETPMFPGRKRWRGAKEVIDWAYLGRSLLDDPKYKKRPLSIKTRQRIARGLERFAGPLAPLYIRLLDLEGQPDHTGSPGHPAQLNSGLFHGSNRQNTAPRSMDEPLHTVTTWGNGGEYLVSPETKPFTAANRTDNAPKDIEEPVPLITTAGGGGIFIAETDLKPFVLGQQSQAAPRSTEEPIPTIAADGAISLVRSMLLTHCGKEKTLLGGPILVQYYSNGCSASSVERPVPTVTTKDRHGLVSPVLAEVDHGKDDQALVNPILVQSSQTGGNGGYARPADDPVPVLTTRNDINLVEPRITPAFGEGSSQGPRAQDAAAPRPQAAGKGEGNPVSPVLAQAVLEDLRASGIDPRRLVFLNGIPHILDIRFRMLQNSELSKAMGFDDEESRYEFTGNASEVTRQIGNAVPVNLAAALVGAMLADSP